MAYNVYEEIQVFVLCHTQPLRLLNRFVAGRLVLESGTLVMIVVAGLLLLLLLLLLL